MKDPLSQALTDSAQPKQADAKDAVAHPLAEALPHLHDQLIKALQLPFFDEGVHEEAVPIIHHTLLESGSLRVLATRGTPAYVAEITIDIRTVKDALDVPGKYEWNAGGLFHHHAQHGSIERTFSVPLSISENGLILLDAGAMTAEMAAIVKEFATEDISSQE